MPEVTASEIGKGLLKLFGKDGEHWVKGNYSTHDGSYCLMGGMEHLGYIKARSSEQAAVNILKEEILGQGLRKRFTGVESFNDSNKTSWPVIKKLLCNMAFPKKGKKSVRKTKSR